MHSSPTAIPDLPSPHPPAPGSLPVSQPLHIPTPTGIFHAAPTPTLCMVLGMQHPKKSDGMWDTTAKQNFGKMSGRESGFWVWDDGMSPTNGLGMVKLGLTLILGFLGD